MSVEDRLLIAIAVAGSFDRVSGSLEEVNDENVPVTFNLPQGRKPQRLSELANETAWKLTEHSPAVQESVTGNREFTLHVPVRFADRDKLLSSISDLESINTSWCRDFIDELGAVSYTHLTLPTIYSV